jgi:hypothetical protein
MTAQRMQLLIDGDAIGLTCKPGEGHPASTMDMRGAVSFSAYISLRELFDPALRDWVMSQLLPLFLAQEPYTKEWIPKDTAIAQAIACYVDLQQRYRQQPRLDPAMVDYYRQRFEGMFRELPFWLKVASYGALQAVILYPALDEAGESALPPGDVITPGAQMLRVDYRALAAPDRLAEMLVRGLDANILFQYEGREADHFSDLDYWKNAVRKDLRDSIGHVSSQGVIHWYLALTGRRNSCFRLPPTDRHFFAEALVDFVRMELLLYAQGGQREPEASQEARQRMEDAFSQMALCYYVLALDPAQRSLVLKQYPDGRIRPGPDYRKQYGANRSAIREPAIAAELDYRVADTFRELCLWAAQLGGMQGEIPVHLIRPQDRHAPEYEPLRHLIAPVSTDYRKSKMRQVFGES